MVTNLQNKPEVVEVRGYTMRPTTWDDLEGVTDLLNAWSLHYMGFSEYKADELKREWEAPDFNLQEDTQIVVATGGMIVGYYEIFDPKPHVRINLWGRVHPEHEKCGISTRLMTWAVQRARYALETAPLEARVGLGVQALANQTDAHELFENHGFELVRHYLRMTIELDGPPAEAEIPAGIVIRSMVRGQDERKIVQAFRDSFRDHWGYVETPFEDTYNRWINYIDDNPEFDPALWFIAEQDGRVAGISLCWEKSFGDPDMGWVGTLGVLRPWRRRGLGLALLQHSFAHLYERGQRKIGLGVDAQSLTGATRLYEKAGMQSDPKHQISVFELELRPGIDLSAEDTED